MPRPESFPIEKIYVPVKRKKEIKPEVVEEIAGSILEIGQQAPILVRPDEGRYVLVEGLHRLEACKALGETTIIGILVSAEPTQQNRPLRENPDAEAERDKMARLKKLRLEKEAAERSAAVLSGFMGAQLVRTHPKGGRDNPKATASGKSGSAPKTLSEWIIQQKRDGSRH